jgi:diguanylate cyclase (GGDEF)-like protein/PAS domain S-box-containing protein
VTPELTTAPARWRGVASWAIGGTVGYLVAYTCWFFLAPMTATTRATATSYATLPATLVLVVAVLVAGLRAGDRRSRIGWLTLAVGLTIVLFSDILGVVSALHGDPMAFEALKTVLSLSCMVVILVALLLFPARHQSRGLLLLGIDIATVGASGLSLIWWFVVAPELSGRSQLTVKLVTDALIYPLLMLALIVAIATIWMRGVGTIHRRTLQLWGFGVLLFLVSSVASVYLELRGNTQAASQLDWLSVAAMSLAAVGALWHLRAGPPAQVAAEPGRVPRPSRLPYVSQGLVLVVLVQAAHQADGIGLAGLADCIGLVVVLGIVRQIVVLADNRRLAEGLELKVHARTAELAATERHFRSLVQHSSDVVLVVDADGRLRYVSDSVMKVLGHDPRTAIHHGDLVGLLGASSRTVLVAGVTLATATPAEPVLVEATVRHGDGRSRQCEVTIVSLLHEPDVAGIVLTIRDVSDQRELQQQLTQQALCDTLTQLPNRALFHDRLEHALRRGARIHEPAAAVLVLDLDGFKEFNDSLGSGAGDRLLVAIADRLAQSLRPGDSLARLRGDEFAVIADSVQSVDDLISLGRRLLTALEPAFHLDEREVFVTASVGVAVATPDSRADDLLRDADAALSAAKRRGSGLVELFEPEMHRAAIERLELASDLRRALERDEFELHYQPIVDMRTGELRSCEALARWRHPQRGMVSPAVFIPVAESSGLIAALGRWALHEACRQAVVWRESTRGASVRVAVNVSARQLTGGELVYDVCNALEASGLPADGLTVEVTESALMQDVDKAVETLGALRLLGIQVALDDFGTGYSSLGYLQRFPVDTIKIDKSFVDGLDAPDAQTALVRAIIGLAHGLGLGVVAEGIERDTQRHALLGMGCQIAQGYLFARPMPGTDFLDLAIAGAVTTTLAGQVVA